jgi:NDP-sugar pyrophosphorylase family protein
LLEEGTLRSCIEAPVFIGTGVIAKKFIILSGSSVDGGAMLDRCFVGQGVKIGKQFSAENSVFFANCEAFHGEACSLFAGPYTVTHHKSTLLIASLASF